jgi:cell division septation protein DedD
MSKSEKTESSGNSGSLIAGILLGMVLGLAAAGGVAWYIIKKNPAAFENKERRESPKVESENKTLASPVAASTPVAVSASAPVAASASAPAAASSVAAEKQHFEFYKVLTDKADGTPQKNNDKSAVPPKVKRAEPAPQAKPAEPVASTKETFYVQAGSFPKEDDAENLKATLAILGLEATLQTAVILDRGTYHRVRLGPYSSSSEMNKVLVLLKQNNISNATPIKVQ